MSCGILFINIKEQTMDTCYDTDEPQKHAHRKKSHTLWFIWNKKSNYKDKKCISGWLGQKQEETGVNSKLK